MSYYTTCAVTFDSLEHAYVITETSIKYSVDVALYSILYVCMQDLELCVWSIFVTGLLSLDPN